MLLLLLRNRKVCCWGGLQWHDVCTRVCENLLLIQELKWTEHNADIMNLILLFVKGVD